MPFLSLLFACLIVVTAVWCLVAVWRRVPVALLLFRRCSRLQLDLLHANSSRLPCRFSISSSLCLVELRGVQLHFCFARICVECGICFAVAVRSRQFKICWKRFANSEKRRSGVRFLEGCVLSGVFYTWYVFTIKLVDHVGIARIVLLQRGDCISYVVVMPPAY